MKVYQVILCFLLWPIFVLSQGKSTVDLVAGLDYSYRSLQTQSSEDIVDMILRNREKEEIAKLNWNLRFNLNLRLSERFFLKAGGRFVSLGYKRTVTDLQWGSEHDGNEGFIEDPLLPRKVDLTYDYRYIQLPIAGRWKLGKGKWTPFVEAGLAPSFYLATRTKVTKDISSEVSLYNDKTSSFNRFQIVGLVSIGIQYQLSEKFHLFAQPIFRYHLTPLSSGQIKENLYNYGLELGMRRRIK